MMTGNVFLGRRTFQHDECIADDTSTALSTNVTKPRASASMVYRRTTKRNNVRAGKLRVKNSDCKDIRDAFRSLLDQIGDEVDFKLPYWLNKRKHTQYTSIKRNIYLTKKVKNRLDDGIFCSCTPSLGSSQACDKDCHCGLLFSSCSSFCGCGNSCLNKPFQYRRTKRMKLVQTEKCGLGVVTDEDIKKGEFVIEYVGEVIDDKTCEERLWKMKHSGETNFYLCEINREMVIDATFKGNTSRYMNHSCAPNTEMQKWIIDGEIRIGMFANRSIKKGEHMTYDYQFVQFGADQECYCGAKKCRKKLGVKSCKPNTSPLDTLQFVAHEVIASSSRLKACLSKGNVFSNANMRHSGHSLHANANGWACSPNCVGEVIRIHHPLNKRLVQFGDDHDCYWNAMKCQKMPGAKCYVPNMSSSDTLQLIAHQVATSSSRLKAVVSRRNVLMNGNLHNRCSLRSIVNAEACSSNCIGKIIRIHHPLDKRSFAMILMFDTHSRKHRIMMEDGSIECVDMSNVDWDFPSCLSNCEMVKTWGNKL